MALDLQSLEGRIRKLQKLRDLLSDEETRELMADPEVLAALKESLVGTNGASEKNSRKPAQDAHKTLFDEEASESKMPGAGTLRMAAYDVALTLRPRFKAKEVLERLEADGYKFDASDHMIAVNTAIRGLMKKGLVRLVSAGSGRKGNQYEIVKGVGKS